MSAFGGLVEGFVEGGSGPRGAAGPSRVTKASSRCTRALVAGVVFATAGGTCAVAGAADDTVGVDTDFVRRPYIGIGAGVSRLEPESSTSALDVSDENDAGVHVFAGYDITRWLSAEVYFADLGAAGISFNGTDVGDVDYSVYGLNAVGYLFNSRSGFAFAPRGGAARVDDGLRLREGLSLYVSAGVGGMSNDSDLEYRRDNDAHAAFGAGLEYGFANGVALRADLSSYDTDAQYASLGVLKRFGTVRPAAVPAEKAPVPAVVPEAESAPVVPIEREETYFFGPIVPPTVRFAFDESRLDADARAALDAFVAEVGDTDFRIGVDGHTDWVSTERYNQGLSMRRARAVADYLVANGIDVDRVEVRGYGETRPVSSNLTDEGRAENRRVEIDLRRKGG